MSTGVDVEEFLQGFLGEADEHVGRITSNLAAIERAPDRGHARELAELLRSLHTLKGLAGMMGIEPIVELVHAMESLVRDVQRRGGRLPARGLDPLVAGTHALAERVRAVGERKTIERAPESLLGDLERVADLRAASAEPRTLAELPGLEPELAAKLTESEREDLDHALERGQHVARVAFVPSAVRADAGITITSVRAALAEHGRIVRVLPHSVAPGGLEFVILVVSSVEPAELAKAAGIEAHEVVQLRAAPPSLASVESDDTFDRGRRGVVRMDVAKLDAALEEIAALGVSRIRLREEVARLEHEGHPTRRLRTLLDDDGRELRRLRATLLALRMVPLREVLEPVPLIVRGMRKSTGKHVQLEVDVGNVELDKTVAERLLPALVHLVRNAVDHGIEDAATRSARGKPDSGRVRLTAVAAAGAMLEICVADDGGGIDPIAVARRAGAPEPADDAALLELLTAPGFSMRDALTVTSGRGIGLDVVCQTMEALGGTLELVNRQGRGTEFRLRAPLSVAILDAFAFEAGGERYLAPIAFVDAIVEIDPSQLVHPPSRRDHSVSMMHLRGDVLPLLSLRRALGLPQGTDETKAMIVRRAAQRFAFSIARMLGRHEVLVRPLVDPLVRVPAIAGSADLGDGRPTLVLDLQRLTHSLADRPPVEVGA